MKTVAIAASAALLLAGMSPVFAQAPNKAPRGDHVHQRPVVSAEDHAAYTEARIAGLRAGLKLTAEQEKHWPAVEAALREENAGFAPREPGEKRGERPNALDRLEKRAEHMSAQGQRLQKLVAASKPLFDSLDDAQKRRFGVLIRGNMGHGPHR